VNPSGAYIELDRVSLQHNAHKVREYAPHSKVIAVIKANAYGHGLLNVAPALQGRVDAFAVARLDEALQLRESGINEKLLVLQGCAQADELAQFEKNKIDMVVHSAHQIEWLEQSKVKFTGNVWLKIDSGMHRLGMSPQDFLVLFSRLRKDKSLANFRFMTHFSSADNIEEITTEQQWQLFLTTIQEHKGYELSAANSAAIVAWPETHQDWVRAGLMLYGASPVMGKTAAALGLLPVMNFYARIIAIKSIAEGESVGYAGTWTAKKSSRLAVVSVGYGDGYPRHIRRGTCVLINGQRCTIVGRVSMDMLSVDITDNEQASVGDQVTLWGKGLPVDEIAEQANTIAYTLLCGITRRVKIKIL